MQRAKQKQTQMLSLLLLAFLKEPDTSHQKVELIRLQSDSRCFIHHKAILISETLPMASPLQSVFEVENVQK